MTIEPRPARLLRRQHSVNTMLFGCPAARHTPCEMEGAGGTSIMRMRVTLFTAAFVMWPMAAFGLLVGGVIWRRLAGVA